MPRTIRTPNWKPAPPATGCRRARSRTGSCSSPASCTWATGAGARIAQAHGWCGHYLGGERYHVAPLGVADDFQESADVLTFAEAQRAALVHRVVRQTGKAPTVADAIAAYLNHLRPERPATADFAAVLARGLILPALGRHKLTALTTEHLTAWRDGLAQQPARQRPLPTTKEQHRQRRASVNRVMTVLKAALNHAFKTGAVEDDLAWRRLQPYKQVLGARPGHLSVAEAQRLINAAQGDFRTLVRAALMTGCRYGELGALDVRDLQRGKLHIRMSKSGRPRNVVLTDEGIAFFNQLAAGRAGAEPLLGRRWIPGAQISADAGRLPCGADHASDWLPCSYATRGRRWRSWPGCRCWWRRGSWVIGTHGWSSGITAI